MECEDEVVSIVGEFEGWVRRVCMRFMLKEDCYIQGQRVSVKLEYEEYAKIYNWIQGLRMSVKGMRVIGAYEGYADIPQRWEHKGEPKIYVEIYS